jgi:hypothetical protein
MVMEYWKPAATPPVEEIQTQLYSKPAHGIIARDMRKYLETHGYRVFAFQGAWKDLEENVSKGRPLIVCLGPSSGAGPLHYVVVAGVDTAQDLVLVNDPAQRKLMPVSRTDFERGWKTTTNWTLLAVPELDSASGNFRGGNLAEARKDLNAALRSDPSDAYINEFLATVCFLQHDMEPALKYWNRAGKPTVENIRIDPQLLTDPLIVARAFTFSRGGVLKLYDYRTTQSRLEAAGVFSRYRFELSEAPDPAGDHFDVTLLAAERHGTNPLSWLRGLPYQTVYGDFSNIGYKAINLESMLRWDPNKRRVNAALAAPLRGNPEWMVRIGLDGREEKWIDGKDPFRMSKAEATAEVRSVPSDQWSWTGGVALSERHFSNSFASGVALKEFASVAHKVVQDTDRQLSVDTSLSLQGGTMLSSGGRQFLKFENRLSMRWLPLPKHQDYEVTAKISLGRAFGTLPFDELFVMGLDRDSDLLLRAHSTTSAGVESTQFAGRSFALANTDYQRGLRKTGLVRISAGPFLDAGHGPISRNWLVDTGARLRVTVLGVTLDASYGRSLTDHSRAFFINSPR